MSAPKGYIYALICPAIGDGQFIKIGATINHPVKRARQLSASTSAALPFQLAYHRYVENPFEVEAEIHRVLNPNRVNDAREFFDVSLHQVIELFNSYRECAINISSVITVSTPFAELFASFPDDGDGRELTYDEQFACRRLEEKIAQG